MIFSKTFNKKFYLIISFLFMFSFTSLSYAAIDGKLGMEAMQAIQTNDYIKINEIGKKIIKKNPEDSYGYNLVAKSLEHDRKYEEAIKYYSKAIEKAEMLNNSKEYKKYGLHENPDYYKRGKCYFAINKYEEALQDLINEENYNKTDDASLHYNKALCLYWLNRYDEASRQITIALRKTPDSKEYDDIRELDIKVLEAKRIARFNILVDRCSDGLKNKDYEKVHDAANELIALHSDKIDGYIFEMIALTDENKYKEAIKCCEAAIKKFSNKEQSKNETIAYMYLHTSRCYYKLKNLKKSLNALNMAIEYSPKDDTTLVNAYLERMRIKKDKKDYNGAIIDAKNALNTASCLTDKTKAAKYTNIANSHIKDLEKIIGKK